MVVVPAEGRHGGGGGSHCGTGQLAWPQVAFPSESLCQPRPVVE